MTTRPVTLALLVVAALGGCYGSTEPATEIGETDARLNGSGTLDRAPALVNFEGQALDGRRRAFSTPQLAIPKGASGPFSRRIAGLDPATTYEYRMCATEEGEAQVCAQTRKFMTRVPDGDRVEGTMQGGTTRGDLFFAEVRARSGPAGQSPSGSLHISGALGGTFPGFAGFVTCLRVTSKSAFTVGAVGRTAGELAAGALRVSGDQTGFRVDPGSAPPDCAGEVATPLPASYDDLFVYDAP